MGFAEPDDDDVRVGSRDSERVQVWVPIEAGDSEGTITIIVRDLGITGARIETRPARFHSGDLVQLRLPLLPAERVGQVKWSEGAIAGIEFAQPLDTPSFRILAKAMKPTQDNLNLVLNYASVVGTGYSKPDQQAGSEDYIRPQKTLSAQSL